MFFSKSLESVQAINDKNYTVRNYKTYQPSLL